MACTSDKKRRVLTVTLIDRSKDGNYWVACGSGAIALSEISYEQNNFSGGELKIIFAEDGIQLGV